MSRWIDADALIKSVERCFTGALTMSEREKVLADVPTIEIVRCKDCRYKDMELCAMHKLVVAGVRKYDDFCSYGERREP